MHINKVNWNTVHNYGKPKWHSFSPSLGWKGIIWALTLSHKMSPRKQATEPKFWSWYNFSQEKSLHIHWYQLLHSQILESRPFRFNWATLYYYSYPFSKNTGVKLDPEMVHWGQIPFRGNDDLQTSQLDSNYDPELGQSDPIISQVCRKLTKFGVTFEPEPTPMDPFSGHTDPGVFRVHTYPI